MVFVVVVFNPHPGYAFINLRERRREIGRQGGKREQEKERKIDVREKHQ